VTHFPVVLFVYNRLEHTRRTIEALRNNYGAAETDVIVFADGAKNSGDEEKVAALQDYLNDDQTSQGFKSLQTINRPENFGLARSIVEGVTFALETSSACIVLEDDIVTSPMFLNYMNTALENYAKTPQVWHISGYNFPIETAELPETFFFRGASCWGWGTWKDRWQHFYKNPAELIRQFDSEQVYEFDYQGVSNNWGQVLDNSRGIKNTWAVFWYATVFKHQGLCLHPAHSLTKNIGHDGSGEHCKPNENYQAEMYDHSRVPAMTRDFKEHAEALKRIRTFIRMARPFHKRIAFDLMARWRLLK